MVMSNSYTNNERFFTVLKSQQQRWFGTLRLEFEFGDSWTEILKSLSSISGKVLIFFP